MTTGTIEPTPGARKARRPITLRTLAEMTSRGDPFACLTCYDATTARWLERAGVHLLLVGDTAAEVILGLPATIHMPLEIAIALTAAVKRGAPNTVVMADMPFMSYQADDAEAVRNAGRFLTDGMADVVKLEADKSFAPLLSKMARAGVPLCGHVGSKPQRSGLTGGYTSAGRTKAQAQAVIDDAMALEDAGCVMLLVEAVPAEVADQILERTTVPMIGIGAGPACHGQILVLQDLLGLTDHQPPFADTVANFGASLQEAAGQWVRRVSAREASAHRYHMRRESV